jgi:hypothetical protein
MVTMFGAPVVPPDGATPVEQAGLDMFAILDHSSRTDRLDAITLPRS